MTGANSNRTKYTIFIKRMKPTRGGSREGAGRKPRDKPREAIAMRLEPQDAAKLRDLCKAREVSQADWITDKIRRSRV